MKRVTSFSLVIIVAALCLNNVSQGQTLSGPLRGSLGPGTYHIVGEIFVLAGDSLNLAPGTVFSFGGDYVFNIYGRISAIGTVNDSIKFIHNPDSVGGLGSYWNGFDFYYPGTDSSRFEYCLINGSDCLGTDFENSSPVFVNCSIVGNNAGGY